VRMSGPRTAERNSSPTMKKGKPNTAQSRCRVRRVIRVVA